jgi:hypothetical protein
MPYTIWQVSLYSDIAMHPCNLSAYSLLISPLFLARFLLRFFANPWNYSPYKNPLFSGRQELPGAARITYKSGNKCHGTIHAVYVFPLFSLCEYLAQGLLCHELPIKAL